MYVEQSKLYKHARTCKSHGSSLISFGFSSLGSLEAEAEELLSQMCLCRNSHVWVPLSEAHFRVFNRLCFAVMRGVDAQLVGTKLQTFI